MCVIYIFIWATIVFTNASFMDKHNARSSYFWAFFIFYQIYNTILKLHAYFKVRNSFLWKVTTVLRQSHRRWPSSVSGMHVFSLNPGLCLLCARWKCCSARVCMQVWTEQMTWCSGTHASHVGVLAQHLATPTPIHLPASAPSSDDDSSIWVSTTYMRCLKRILGSWPWPVPTTAGIWEVK